MKRLVDALAPGQRVFVSAMSAESALLREELRADPERARGVTFGCVQFPGVDKTDYLAFHAEARQRAFMMTPAVRKGIEQGRAELLSTDYRAIERQLIDDAPVDVAIAHLTPPDAEGFCSPGVGVDFMPLVWSRAKKRVAHLNPQMPRTRSSFRVHMSELDAFVESAAPLLEMPSGPIGEVETAIGKYVASLVRDGDTLQFGVGAIPAAVGQALASHRRLRMHGGLGTETLRILWEAGALDRDARLTSGVLLGNAAFYDFCAGLDTLWLTDVRETHGAAALARIPRFMGINSAIEVDLFGQVNSERADGTLHAGPGGLPAYAAAAQASAGGRLLICLPSTAKKGTVSRIVPALDARAVCTVPRYLTDVVITEHGIAELRGRSLDARAAALIGIAAPDQRGALERAWADVRTRA